MGLIIFFAILLGIGYFVIHLMANSAASLIEAICVPPEEEEDGWDWDDLK